MPSNSWANDWITGDIPPASEFRKGMGCIASSTAGGAVASFDITAIIGTYAVLEFECAFLSDQAGGSSVNISFNADVTAANYSRNTASAGTVYGNGSFNDRQSGLYANGTTNPAYGSGWLKIPAYAGNQKKSWTVLGAIRDGATTSQIVWGGGHWIAAGATAAITRVTFTPVTGNFAANSSIFVYVRGN